MNTRPSPRSVQLLDDWDPMVDDHSRPNFNSYRRPVAAEYVDGLEEDQQGNASKPLAVYVSRIPGSLDREGLRNIFSACGCVRNVFYSNGKKYGFVHFTTHAEAQRAIVKFNNQPPHNMIVNLARDRRETVDHGNNNNHHQNSFSRAENRQYSSQAMIGEELHYYDQNAAEVDDYGVANDEDDNGDDLESSNLTEEDIYGRLVIAVDNEKRQVTLVRSLSNRPEFGGASYMKKNSRYTLDCEEDEEEELEPLACFEPTEKIIKNQAVTSSVEVATHLSLRSRIHESSPENSVIGPHIQEAIGFQQAAKKETAPNRELFNMKSVARFAQVQHERPRPLSNDPGLVNFDRSPNDALRSSRLPLLPNPPSVLGVLKKPNPSVDSFLRSPGPTQDFGANEIVRRPHVENKFGAKFNRPYQYPLQTPTTHDKEGYAAHHGKSLGNFSSAGHEDVVVNNRLKTIATVELQLNEPEDAIVTHMEEGSFWIQKKSSAHLMVSCTSDLQRAMENRGNVYHPRIGDVCIAKFTADDKWYRAQIKDCTSTATIVYYLDFGNSEQISYTQLRPISDALLKLPAQAVKCKLDAASRISFKQLKLDGIYSLTACRREGGYTVVTLEDSQKREPKAVNEIPVGVDASCITSPVLLHKLKVNKRVNISVTVVLETEFWGQLICTNEPEYSDCMTELILGMENAANFPAMNKLDGRSLPAIVAAFSKAENAWYRAVRLPDSVFYIDFGSEEKVEEFRQLPEKLLNLPTALVHASVEKVFSDKGRKPLAEQLSVESEIDFIPQSMTGYVVNGILTNGFDHIPIANVKLSPWFHKVKVPKVTITPKLKMNNLKPDQRSLPKVTQQLSHKTVARRFKHSDLPRINVVNGQSYDVFFLSVNFGSIFVIQKDHFLLLKKVTDKLQEVCSSDPRGYMPVEGELICSRFSEDNKWYRAQVTAVYEDRADVYFIDYGNDEVVVFDRVRKYPETLLSYHPFAWKVEVATKSSAFITKLTSFATKQQSLTMIVKDKSASSIIVEFFMEDGKTPLVEPVSKVKDTLLQCSTSVKNDCKQLSDMKEKRDITKTLNQNSKEKQSSTLSSKGREKKLPTLEILPKRLFKKAEKFIVSFNVTDGEDIYVSLEDDMSLMDEVNEHLTAFCANQRSNYCPSVSEIVCGKNVEDNTWCRVQVLKLLPERRALVHFIDYGTKVELAYDHLQELPDSALKHPVLAKKVKISNGQASMLESYVNESLCPLLNMLVIDGGEIPTVMFTGLDDEPLFTKCENEQGNAAEDYTDTGSNNVCKVAKLTLESLKQVKCAESRLNVLILNYIDLSTVMVIPVEHGKALQKLGISLQSHCTEVDTNGYLPDVNELVCAYFDDDQGWYRAEVKEVTQEEISVVFVDYGNTIVVKKDKVRVLPEDAVKLPVYSFIVHTDKQSMMLLAENQDTTVVMTVVDQTTNPVSVKFITAIVAETQPSSEIPDAGGEQSHVNKSKFFHEDMKTLELPLGEVTLIAVTIFTPEIIFCTVADVKNLQELDDLTEEINKWCSKESNVAYKPHERDELCLAKFTDGSWYRASTLVPSSPQAKLFFIDYGNIESVSVTDIREMQPQFVSLPAQAVQCSLFNLKDQNWDENTCMKLKEIMKEPFEAIVKEKTEDCCFIECPDLSPQLQPLGIFKEEQK